MDEIDVSFDPSVVTDAFSGVGSSFGSLLGGGGNAGGFAGGAALGGNLQQSIYNIEHLFGHNLNAGNGSSSGTWLILAVGALVVFLVLR